MDDGKIRHVDFWPDEWLSGARGLKYDERGVYITACAIEYSQGHAYTEGDLRDECPGDVRVFRRILATLIEKGKLRRVEGGRLTNKRCRIELERARKRIVTSQENGREHKGNRRFSEPAGSELGNTNEQPVLLENKKGGDGRSAPSEEPLTAEERAELAERFAEVRDAINGPKVRDPEKRKAAITANKRQLWLRSIDAWISRRFEGEARTSGWELTARAEAAGSRDKMTKADRRELDRLDELYRAESENAEPMKEAAD